MEKIPTDLEILQCIYETYVEDFRSYSKLAPTRSSRIYVPIDIKRLAELLETDEYLLHGRLYYHLDQKYRYIQDDDSRVHLLLSFFEVDCPHSIHFPYLTAILSERYYQYKKNMSALALSFLSLVVSVIAVIIAAQHK